MKLGFRSHPELLRSIARIERDIRLIGELDPAAVSRLNKELQLLRNEAQGSETAQ